VDPIDPIDPIDYPTGSLNDPQPPPVPNPDGSDIWHLVVLDMLDRRHKGIVKYGVPLQAFNGRDAIIDAYQEALDLVVYLRQVIEEKERGK